MHRFPLLRLIRQAFSERTVVLEWIPVELKQADDAPTNDPADMFTDWPPQPMIPWLNAPQG